MLDELTKQAHLVKLKQVNMKLISDKLHNYFHIYTDGSLNTSNHQSGIVMNMNKVLRRTLVCSNDTCSYWYHKESWLLAFSSLLIQLPRGRMKTNQLTPIISVNMYNIIHKSPIAYYNVWLQQMNWTVVSLWVQFRMS